MSTDNPMIPLSAMRAIAVEAIRAVTSCPDIKGNEGRYLVDELEAVAKAAAETLKQEAREDDLMAECMALFRADMIEAGIVTKATPPMFMTEGVLGAFAKLKAEVEALRADAERYRWLKDRNNPLTDMDLGNLVSDYAGDLLDEKIDERRKG